MRLFYLLMIMTLLASSVDSAHAAEADEWHKLDVQTSLQKQATSVFVLTPSKLQKGKAYRVIYVLPVVAGRNNRWGNALAEISALDIANRYGVVCVFPTFADLPWYADHPTDQKLQQERYLLEAVVPLIEEKFPVAKDRQGRMLVGFSKSGWGAWTLLLRHPDLFERAAAFDAPLMKQKPNQFGMGAVFGTQENFEKYRIDRLLEKQVKVLGNKPRLALLGLGNFGSHHDQARGQLQRLHIPFAEQKGPRRKHSWDSGWLEPAIQFVVLGRLKE